MDELSKPSNHAGSAWSSEVEGPTWVNAVMLLTWLLAGIVAFIPFAFSTSPWDAVTLRVPGNQGNWWHVFAGAPFFLAFPMLWLRLQSLSSRQLPSAMQRRLIWSVVGLSACGTTLVEAPFLLHLAGTSEWQRLSVLSLGFGTMFASAIILLFRRRTISPVRACVIGLNTAYLANTALCLVVYGGATGTKWSKLGWLISTVIVCPIVFELIWLLIQTLRTQTALLQPRAA
jgi:hypothetical protein